MAPIDDIEKKRGRGRPKTDALPILVRLLPADLVALDAALALEPDPKPSRPEMIRRAMGEGLKVLSRPRKSPWKPAGATAPAVAEKAAKVRSKAASAADEALKGIEAPAEVKAARRKALTEKPAMVAKARAKRKGAIT